MNDPEVLEALNAQLSFKEKIENNTSLAKDISLGAFDGDNYKKFANENGLVVKEYLFVMHFYHFLIDLTSAKL